jgi:hypothetical protein
VTADVDRFRQDLEGLSPRAFQAIQLRMLEARSREECARFFGIPPESFDIMLLRAAAELLHFQGQLPWAEEVRQAAVLAQALETPSPSDPRAAALRRLGEVREPLRQALRDAEAAREASPARTRELWIRRALIVVIVALTAWFYLRQPR